jgi:hypothetical protein
MSRPKTETVWRRIVTDTLPAKARSLALEQIARPSPNLLRRLSSKNPRPFVAMARRDFRQAKAKAAGRRNSSRVASLFWSRARPNQGTPRKSQWMAGELVQWPRKARLPGWASKRSHPFRLSSNVPGLPPWRLRSPQ